jgi:dimethylargininase
MQPDQPVLHSHCLVRNLPNSFESSIKQHSPVTPIDLELAKLQHQSYVQTLNRLVPNVIEVDVDEKHPDCCFIEDTAIVIKDTAVITWMGASERRGEEVQVKAALLKAGIQRVFEIQPPGFLDGGDVLYTGKDLFVGLSKRSNPESVAQLAEIFQDRVPVYGFPVIEGLHLKSIMSAFDSNTLIVGASQAGAFIVEEIKRNPQLKDRYTFVFVPDPVASNVLRIGSTLVVQEGYPMSEAVLKELCEKHGVSLVKLNMSELIKADGALTCCSILFQV